MLKYYLIIWIVPGRFLSLEDWMVMSLEIRPLAALYPPPHTKNVFYRAAISSFALDFCSLWYTYMGGGYNAAMGLISRDIADWILDTKLVYQTKTEDKI